MRFRSYVSSVTPVAAIAIIAISSTAEAQRGTFSSRSHGPTFGVSVGSVALSSEPLTPDSRKDFAGAGVQMEVGWHMLSSHFGMLIDYANINIDEEGPPLIRRYSHINALGRYSFRSDRDIVRPYLEMGIGRREVTGRTSTSGLPPVNVRTQSIGGTIGGGMQVFLARPVSLDFGAQVGIGGFDDWKSNGTVNNAMPALEQSSVVARLGLRFWPGL